ncbi:hypothetical protein [Singulisphaera acidiphila]|uniref:Uncharacterized protein n=1 Tax=Singulisphaera acidiphila (strain ATCC BAA-1392 / DSM 18658 / VKM B-2454 / MOB10) TaxID=886293 RepID=L0DGY6_SINAD|nr:hypothetical protein [Singulisphaera acidiphila]AGA27916.1 hypothetical protein Sinac_3670 [Singulisphaera acidiphila DSM 18658]
MPRWGDPTRGYLGISSAYFQATEESANDSGGVGAMFGPIEFREIALEESGQAVRTALDGFGCEDQVVQEVLSFGVIQK